MYVLAFAVVAEAVTFLADEQGHILSKRIVYYYFYSAYIYGGLSKHIPQCSVTKAPSKHTASR